MGDSDNSSFGCDAWFCLTDYVSRAEAEGIMLASLTEHVETWKQQNAARIVAAKMAFSRINTKQQRIVRELSEGKVAAESLKARPVNVILAMPEEEIKQAFNMKQVQSIKKRFKKEVTNKHIDFPSTIHPAAMFMAQLGAPTLLPSLTKKLKFSLQKFLPAEKSSVRGQSYFRGANIDSV